MTRSPTTTTNFAAVGSIVAGLLVIADFWLFGG